MDARQSDGGSADRVVTFVTREGCHLCEAALVEVERARREFPFRLEILDLAERPDLEPAFGERIPFLLIDGVPAFKYRLLAGDLVRKLRSGPAGNPGTGGA
jgi:hypothetical protein